LLYDGVRQSPSPETALMDFLYSAYEAGANFWLNVIGRRWSGNAGSADILVHTKIGSGRFLGARTSLSALSAQREEVSSPTVRKGVLHASVIIGSNEHQP
jgi:hypothetical protein